MLPATVAGPLWKQIWRNSHFAWLIQGALLLVLVSAGFPATRLDPLVSR